MIQRITTLDYEVGAALTDAVNLLLQVTVREHIAVYDNQEYLNQAEHISEMLEKLYQELLSNI